MANSLANSVRFLLGYISIDQFDNSAIHKTDQSNVNMEKHEMFFCETLNKDMLSDVSKLE